MTTVTNGIITDVLPDGLQYVDGLGQATPSSPSRATTTTRTLTWTAAKVSESGTVTYKAPVHKGATELSQPLDNVATIDSDQTLPDDASDGRVRPGRSRAPRPLRPPTPSAPRRDPGEPGFSLMLILAVLGGPRSS